jgi:hypothetical protein
MKSSTVPRYTKIDSKFWQQFAINQWEKKPLLVRNIQTSIRTLDENVVFTMLVAYSEHCRKQNSTTGFKLFVDGVRQYDEEILQILPLKSDRSLKGYHLRIEKIFSDYCLVCDELLQVSENQWSELQDFTQGLFQYIGLPNRFAEIGLYLGNYKTTPFGVHVDGCGVFSLPVVGKKKFRLWKPTYTKKNPQLIESHHYLKHKAASQLLEVHPGDMSYWPSQAWHIAESDGSFTATWSLGVWVNRPHIELVTEAMTSLIRSSLGTNALQATVPFSKKLLTKNNGQRLPIAFENSVAIIKNLSKAQLHDAMLISWLGLNSKKGLKTPPRFSKQSKLKINSKISFRVPEAIIWARLKSENTFCYACNGSVVQSTSKKLQKLVHDLSKKQDCLISNYLSGPQKTADLAILQKLANNGALVSSHV